jgi:hypothetical protein
LIGRGATPGPEDEFEVERIVAMRTVDEFRVRWAGYGEADDTWEPRSNLLGAVQAKAAEFEAELRGKQQDEERAKPRKSHWKAPLCGKPLSTADHKLWKQAVALLVGLRARNDFDEAEFLTDMTAEVGKALHVSTYPSMCQDCGVKVGINPIVTLGKQILNMIGKLV